MRTQTMQADTVERLRSFGAQVWTDGEGELHRDGDLPALIYPEGSKEWWVHGQLHREGGPAVELVNGKREWWLRGVEQRPPAEYVAAYGERDARRAASARAQMGAGRFVSHSGPSVTLS